MLQGRAPLHKAAQFGHTEVAKLLLMIGANPNAADEYVSQFCTDKQCEWAGGCCRVQRLSVGVLVKVEK